MKIKFDKTDLINRSKRQNNFSSLTNEEMINIKGGGKDLIPPPPPALE